MEGGKLLSDPSVLDELRQERDNLDTDLKLLNHNLETLTGRRAQSIVYNRKRDQRKPDLNDNTLDIHEDDSTNRGIKRDRSHSGDITSSSSSESPEPRRHSVKLSSVLILPSRRQNDITDEAKRKAILDSQRNDKQVFDRNRRMFGMLMGTLKQFKTEETGREGSTMKRSKIEEKLEMAVEEERATVTNEVDKILEQKHKKEQLLDRTESKLDVVYRFKNWENTHRHLCGYIQTETKPKIFWLPKEHTLVTEKKLKETRDYFSLCVAERTAKFKKDMHELGSDLRQSVKLEQPSAKETHKRREPGELLPSPTSRSND